MFFFMSSSHEMAKHDYNEEETVWMRLKPPKLGFLLDLSNLKPNSHRDVQVVTLRHGASNPGNVATCGSAHRNVVEYTAQVLQRSHNVKTYSL